jgi:hypothetical protein
VHFDKRQLILAFGAFALAASLCLASVTWATPINHGDFPGDGVVFLSVSEDSLTDPGALPLFGSPMPSGASLDFNGISFASFAIAGSFDMTNGRLTMGIEAQGDNSIDSISFSEAGTYTLLGTTGAAALASVSATAFLDILEVDGIGITPINLQADLIFPSSSGQFALPMGGQAGGTWNGELELDVKQALRDENIQGRATKVWLTVSNMLFTTSDPGAASFIDTADLDISVQITPEPTPLVLLGTGLVGLFFMGERRQPGRRQRPRRSGS